MEQLRRLKDFLCQESADARRQSRVRLIRVKRSSYFKLVRSLGPPSYIAALMPVASSSGLFALGDVGPGNCNGRREIGALRPILMIDITNPVSGRELSDLIDTDLRSGHW